MLVVLAALAADCLPDASVQRDRTIAPDGSVWLLTADAAFVCWWVVDDNGDEHVASRWDMRGPRRPVAIEALSDGRALLVLEDEDGWELGVRAIGGAHHLLDIELPGPPTELVAHPEVPLAGVRIPLDANRSVVWLVDVNEERVSATAAVDASADLGFASGDTRLRAGGRLLGARVSDALR